MHFHSPHRRSLLVLPLLASFASGCVTLIDPLPPLLRIHTDSVAATVRDSSGRVLGTTPFAARIPVRQRQRLVLEAPGYDSAVVMVGRQTKEAWIIDGATGAVWRHDPAILSISLSPSVARLPDPAPDTSPRPAEAVPDEVAAVVLREFADAAERAGCEPLLVDAWRDAARVLGDEDRPVADSVRRMAADEVQRAAPEIGRLCTQPSPRVERLREIRAALAEDPGPAAPEGVPAPPLAPVFFGPDQWQIREDAVRARLRTLGARFRDAPVTLVVEGFMDAGELRHQELGYQRAMSVIRELQRGGMRADCCVAISRASASADDTDASRNRRVTLTVDYERAP